MSYHEKSLNRFVAFIVLCGFTALNGDLEAASTVFASKSASVSSFLLLPSSDPILFCRCHNFGANGPSARCKSDETPFGKSRTTGINRKNTLSGKKNHALCFCRHFVGGRPVCIQNKNRYTYQSGFSMINLGCPEQDPIKIRRCSKDTDCFQYCGAIRYHLFLRRMHN